MPWQTIEKGSTGSGVAPNMADYEDECRSFTWEKAGAELDGLGGGLGLNMAHEAVDRHAVGPAGTKVALRCIDLSGARHDISYRDLARRTNRFANALEALGVRAGDRVFVLSPRTADLYVAVLGALKHRAVLCPLFPAFGPETIRQRMDRGGARVLVTTPELYRRKVAKIREALPGLRHVLLIGGSKEDTEIAGTLDLDRLLALQPSSYDIPRTDPRDAALLHFTSGTTGMPKGAIHGHEAVVALYSTGRLALDLHPDDVFWCTAEPGWVTATSYGVISPLTCGVTTIVEDGDFDAERWYRVLEDQQVTVWYTSPTALRMLAQAGRQAAAGHDLGALRFIASVGEPLNPELVVWAQESLGLPVHDTWWQTETGAIMIANYQCLPIRPGSMGRPLPGIEAAVLLRDAHDEVVVDDAGRAVEAGDGHEGELALRPGWPSMFHGYLDQDDRDEERFADGWYLTGDLARRDDQGYFWFVGRADDVIKSAGHLSGSYGPTRAL